MSEVYPGPVKRLCINIYEEPIKQPLQVEQNYLDPPCNGGFLFFCLRNITAVTALKAYEQEYPMLRLIEPMY